GLAQLRLNRRLVTVDDDDLRFDRQELGAYLVANGGGTGPADVEALARRSGGWVAAVALGGPDGPGTALDRWGTEPSDQQVVDFLREEVLDELGAELQDFLVTTSVLDRFDQDLAAAVWSGDVPAMFEELRSRRL